MMNNVLLLQNTISKFGVLGSMTLALRDALEKLGVGTQLYQVDAQPSIWLVDQQGILRYFDLRGETLGQAVRNLLRENMSN